MGREGGQHRPLPLGRREEMLQREEVGQIMALHDLGWGSKRIARELGVARNTVKRYVAAGGWAPYRAPKRAGKLDGLRSWLEERFYRHRGNCDVVRQELREEHGIVLSLRTVERACQGFRAELAARARATVRFETPPGQQLQIDFGEATVRIGGEKRKLHVFVATLGYSRLGYVAVFPDQRQSSWFAGLEGAFGYFGGIPRVVLVDNAKPLVVSHDAWSRQVVFNERFLAFARHWDFRPKACSPYRARTKGKDENGVGYVKRNALAGREFTSWEALEAHLLRWQREVAEVRIHGTTGETPRSRFEREERRALSPLAGRPSYEVARELVRMVSSEACVEVDTNYYSVPWKLIGEAVRVRVEKAVVVVSRGATEVARHARLFGSRERSIDASHFDGLTGPGFAPRPAAAVLGKSPGSGELARPLSEYEALIGGSF
ncbi:MAG: IS21 family transposase [Candidatus Methylacidiphilaceae bacterium]